MRASALVQDGAVQRFWADEYALDLRLSRLAKPVVAFLDGVVMGGGIGLGGHVSHRLVTERTVLAMPEVGIGFAPDVGGTWLLSRPEGEVGTHLALTAGRVGAADGIAIGLADAYVLAADREAVVAALAAGASADEVVATHARPTPTPEEQAWIDAAYRHDTVPEIVAALRARPEPAATKAADDIERMAPTAVAVTLESLRRSRRLPDLEAALAQELRVSDAFTRHPDFAEGIRAQIVDKDRNPTWTPATLGEVTAADVAAFF
jgi:enoyl-CoA hydratase